MLRTIIWFVYFWGYLVVLIPAMLYIIYLEHRGNSNKVQILVENFARNWARRLIKLAGGTVTIDGIENLPQTPYIAVSNHQGTFDIPIMISLTRDVRAIIAKKELAKLPFISWWMKKLNCFFLNRKDARQGAKVVIEAIKYVNAGNSLTIFPEGTRSKSNNLGEFHGGAFTIAKKSKSPIVPITINGSYKLFEANGIFMKPAHVKVTIHKPILPENQSDDISDVVKNIINTAL